MEWRYLRSEVVPFAGMLSAECTNVLLNVLFKAAVSKGMSYYVFIVYTFAIATTVLFLPFFLFSRKTVFPSPKAPFIYKMCLYVVTGFAAQVIGYKGIAYSSPTLASAMSNLIPAFTFIFAVIFRMEKIDLRSSITMAKIVGAVVSISGALMVVLYKGPVIFSSMSSSPTPPLHSLLGSGNSDWLIGGIMLTVEYTLYALWYIIQGQILRMCPSELVVSFLFVLGVTIVSAPIGYFVIHDMNAWRLRLDIASVAFVYSGTFGACYNLVVHSWGNRLKGPVYVAMFKPLSIAIAVIMGAMFLGDAFHIGSVIGAVIISVGFYTMLWGKVNEEETNDDSYSIVNEEETNDDSVNIDDGLQDSSSLTNRPLLKASDDV